MSRHEKNDARMKAAAETLHLKQAKSVGGVVVCVVSRLGLNRTDCMSGPEFIFCYNQHYQDLKRESKPGHLKRSGYSLTCLVS